AGTAEQLEAAVVRTVLGDLRVMARGDPGPDLGLAPDYIARLLELPMAGELAWEAGLLGDLAREVPPGANPRGPLARFCAGFWERVLVASGPHPPRPDVGGPALTAVRGGV